MQCCITKRKNKMTSTITGFQVALLINAANQVLQVTHLSNEHKTQCNEILKQINILFTRASIDDMDLLQVVRLKLNRFIIRHYSN